MNTNGLFSIINVRQGIIYEDFKRFDTLGRKMPFLYVDFVEYVKNYTVVVSNIPPNSLNQYRPTLQNKSDADIVRKAYETLCGDVINSGTVNTELKAVSCLFVEQCVLASNSARCYDANPDNYYNREILTGHISVLPAFPIVLSEISPTVHIDFLDRDIPIWYYDEDNSLINEVAEYIKDNPDTISNIISPLINKYPNSVSNCIYPAWLNALKNIINNEDGKILMPESNLTLQQVLYYELAILKLASCGVFIEINL